MGRLTIIVSVSCWIAWAGHGWSAETLKSGGAGVERPVEGLDVDRVLDKVRQAAKDLQSYQCRIDYRVRQPLLESETRRAGDMVYLRQAKGSRLRVNFETLQQDQDPPQPHVEQFLFDGVWLTQVDHTIKTVTKRQMADPNKPADAFDLASRDLPIVGFTGVEDLGRDFEIRILPPLSGQKAPGVIRLSLKARPESRFYETYRSITFGVDPELWLPAQVEAESAEGDIHQVSFIRAKVNQRVDEAVFDLKIPQGFGEPEIIPLEAERGTDSPPVP